MRILEVTNNSDFQRRALLTILGITLIAGAFWAATRPADTFNSTPTPNPTPNPTMDNSSLDSLESVDDGIFQREYFGYPVLCGMLNTSEYGHPETVDHTRPIFDSAGEIFEQMGDRVDQDTKVMVIKGPELSFRDTQKGTLYTVDANRTVYCLTEEQ